MGKNWAIVIGINQYRNLQPLQYAVQDAVAVRDFFLSHPAEFEQIYYFSDQSPPIEFPRGQMRSVPTYGNLKRFLRDRFQAPFLVTSDNLWFFFAGHGELHDGHDYLMPIDADPSNIEETALRISDVSAQLRNCGADNVVMLIDASHSQGSRRGFGLGREDRSGIVTIYSCRPQELSYEIAELQHGAFTYALLKGLRLQGAQNCATVERLDQYLRHQVPQLNQRYGKPAQTPYTEVEPIAKNRLILLPQAPTLLADVKALKVAAFEAESERNVRLAEHMWIRALAVSADDQQAIQAIQRLAQLRPSFSVPEPLVNTNRPSGADRRGGSRMEPPGLPLVLTRRQLIGLGLGSAGVGGALLVKSLWPMTSSPSSGSPVITVRPFGFNLVNVNAEGKKINRQRGKAQFFTEDLGRGLKLEMVAISGGTFQMGSPGTEEKRYNGEGPQHSVTIKPFLIGKYAVTQAQWQAVAALPQVNRVLRPNPANFKGANRPVERVSWHDAVEFCDRLSRHTKRNYRLPSEAEWEYACRAGTMTPFHFGETITTVLANYRGTDLEDHGTTYPGSYGAGPKGTDRKQTTEVGSFKVANAFGLYDMHGNVWEWCLDPWHANYQGAPNDGSVWTSKDDSGQKLLRGGSWYDPPGFCRSALRYWVIPDRRLNTDGFRVVCSSAWTL
jgi:formylglycine-generating enzyme required for sulfatase activity/uncharacterized caspase-like protein